MPKEFNVSTLGPCTIDNPLKTFKKGESEFKMFLRGDERVIVHNTLEYFQDCIKNGNEPLTFEMAGVHEKIYFDPKKTKVAIVTCGGLCPGLNNVIRGLVFQLFNRYGVNRVVGIRYGYEGFIAEFGHDIVDLTPELVDNIHNQGGSFLGSSRGEQDGEAVVDSLERMNINILFTVGGDGTQRGAHVLAQIIAQRGLKIAVCGIPKTIDNDINYIERSFGYETAFSMAYSILRDAHNEAKGAYNGIALVKLMGRDSGFIAASAALSVPDVNFVLVPEMNFDLLGPGGFIKTLKKRLQRKQHALVVIAEGAGQSNFEKMEKVKDASGNVLHHDIGIYIKEAIREQFEKEGFPFSIRYIDPSYIIRSAPANASDSKFCNQLAQNAVHATMAGRTDFIIGNWNGHFTLLPIEDAVKKRKKIDLESDLWRSVLDATGQPESMRAEIKNPG